MPFFTQGDCSAQYSVRFASLIETAKLNGVNALAYLTALLDALAPDYPMNLITELNPWRWRRLT